jgi:hypothetical protein
MLHAAERNHFSRGEVLHIGRKRVRVHLRVAGKHLGEDQPDMDLATILLVPETTYASLDQNIKVSQPERPDFNRYLDSLFSLSIVCRICLRSGPSTFSPRGRSSSRRRLA